MNLHINPNDNVNKAEQLADINDLRIRSGLPKIVPKRRKCLKCSKSFISMGNWNRICDNCNRENNRLGDEEILVTSGFYFDN